MTDAHPYAEDGEHKQNADPRAFDSRKVPSWFPPEDEAHAAPPPPITTETVAMTLAERYRSILEAQALQAAAAEQNRDRAKHPTANAAAMRAREKFLREAEAETRRRLRRRARGSIVPYAIAGMAAVLTGVGFGYAYTQHERLGQAFHSFAAVLAAPPQVTEAPRKAADSVVEKKPIVSAKIEVQDLSGNVNSMIPLMLSAEPGDANQNLILKLSGLPAEAYLTAGTRDGDGWELSPAQAQQAKLVIPRADQSSFDVSVAAFEGNTGQLAAPVKEFTVAIVDSGVQVAPASAPADTVTTKPAQVKPEAAGLLTKGNALLQSGDIVMARQFFERAFAMGSVEAAIGVGKTYDPVVYEALKVQGLKPDPLLAMEWYMRAGNAGSSEAMAAIEALKSAAQ
ncbi:MAG: hypothetical protein FJX63_05200 [Alphaproteobacteria bacterium]|nr:hypothetical protein [Alphaproteobacteria bacterium]